MTPKPMEKADADFSLTPQQEKIMMEKVLAMVKRSVKENHCGTMEKKALAKLRKDF